MINVTKAKESLTRLEAADMEIDVLTNDERRNLVAIIDEWWQQEGWDPAELRQPYVRDIEN